MDNGRDVDGGGAYLPLFEPKSARGRLGYWLYAASVYAAIAFILFYRVTHLPLTVVPDEEQLIRRWAWIGFFFAELWFALYWFITQSLRWNPIHYCTFKDRLSQRYEQVLPSVDIFVCTANHELEPPVMVVNTLLSLMAYNYPSDKLNVYLSDDGGSELMFYALLEASRFSKHWLPFCKHFNVEPRSPAAYFSTPPPPLPNPNHYLSIKQLYEEMETRIEDATRAGRLSDQLRQQHKGFREWDLVSSRRDHQTILEILISGRDIEDAAVDVEGRPLPMLVYLAREKRPHHHHNYKAGAMNALIRVSSIISNSPIILNVDCDMYSNNSESLRDALCFLMDEEEGHRIAFVQYPQNFNNITKNDLYSNALLLINEVDFPGMNASGGPMYIGTGCFHKRDALTGMKYSKESKIQWKETRNSDDDQVIKEPAHLLETSKILSSSTYEQNTQWGNEMGLKYGCLVEDVITGLSIQCRGWRSAYFNPERKGFVGVAPTTLLQTLIQHKRWAEGDFQIFLSKHCPFLLGRGMIPLKLQISYCNYLLWPPCSLATLFYIAMGPFCLIRGISIFPQLSSLWILPYAYIVMSTCTFNAAELVCSGSTLKGWWNDQRIWLYKRLTSFLFAFAETILKLMGFSKSGFVITAKVAEEDVSYRYEQEIMEFGAPSIMFKVLATIALFCLFSLASIAERSIREPGRAIMDDLGLQTMLSGSVVIINLPLYQAMFSRKDTGRMPFSVTFQSLVLASLAYLLALY